MSFRFNPQAQLGNAAKGLTGLPLIVGLPSPQSIIPNFALGMTTEESSKTSNTMPGMQISSGDLFLKSARDPGTYTVKMAISENPNVKSETIQNIAKALQQISSIANTLAVFGGGTVPNISGITTNFAVSQINSLRAIKDGFQPVLALNLYMPLSSFSTINPNLSSAWYIEEISYEKGESEAGVVATITFKELLMKRDSSYTVLNILKNIANELIGPAVGSSIGSVL